MISIHNFEIISRIITTVVAIFGIGKIFYDITTGTKYRLREEYKFAKEFLGDLKNNPDLHPFVLEKGYQAIAGSVTIKSEEVAYLLSLKNPRKCLNDYILAKKYLNLINTNGDFHLEFVKKHSRNWLRKTQKICYLSLYCVFALIAFAPQMIPSKYGFFIFATLPIFGYCALLSLSKYIEIDRSEQLISSQEKHTSTIHLPTPNASSPK
jgi:hypothetical protein